MFVRLALRTAFAAVFGTLAAGCVPLEETRELSAEGEQLGPRMAHPGGKDQIDLEQSLEDPTEQECGPAPEDLLSTAVSPPTADKKPSSGASPTGCGDAPPSWEGIHNTPQEHVDWLYCHQQNPNNWLEMCSWFGAADGPGGEEDTAKKVASSCSEDAGEALLICLMQATKAALADTDGVCRDHAYLFRQACHIRGLSSANYETSSTHAWVEVTLGSTKYLVDPYNSIIIRIP